MKLVNHFKAHFNPPPPETVPTEITNPPDFIADLQQITQNIDIDSTPPTADEIQTTLSKLHNKKSSNDVPPEFLKAAAQCEKFISIFKSLTDEIWHTRKVPSFWGHGRLEALFKGKGSKADPSKYRGLNVGSCIAKAIISIILTRLFEWYNLGWSGLRAVLP